jgi:hypothetical protein
MNLTELEKQIVIFIIRKKKFDGYQDIKFTCNFFNKARQTILKKKNEDSLKFIFKKALKNLKQEFKRKNQNLNGNLSIDEFDFKFYNFYFGEISKNQNIPLEKFYHFRNWKSRTSTDIPKSVTKKYLSRLKKNKEFMNKIVHFLKNKFWVEFHRMNSIKIQHLIIKWEQFIQENDCNESGMKQIESSITGRGNKLPWTIFEAEYGYKKTLDSISKA